METPKPIDTAYLRDGRKYYYLSYRGKEYKFASESDRSVYGFLLLTRVNGDHTRITKPKPLAIRG